MATEILDAIADIPSNTWDVLESNGGWSNLLSNRATMATRIWTSFRGMLSDVCFWLIEVLNDLDSL